MIAFMDDPKTMKFPKQKGVFCIFSSTSTFRVKCLAQMRVFAWSPGQSSQQHKMNDLFSTFQSFLLLVSQIF